MSVTSATYRPQNRLNQASGGGLSQAPNAQLSLQQLWPTIQKYAAQYGVDPKVMAGIVAQESSFKNHTVHRDGTGHGLIGLDDNGLLPDFEKFAGMSVGRGANAAIRPSKLYARLPLPWMARPTRPARRAPAASSPGFSRRARQPAAQARSSRASGGAPLRHGDGRPPRGVTGRRTCERTTG